MIFRMARLITLFLPLFVEYTNIIWDNWYDETTSVIPGRIGRKETCDSETHRDLYASVCYYLNGFAPVSLQAIG